MKTGIIVTMVFIMALPAVADETTGAGSETEAGKVIRGSGSHESKQGAIYALESAQKPSPPSRCFSEW